MPDPSLAPTAQGVPARPAVRAAALMVFTTLVWGANAVAARMAVGEVPPMLLTGARWLVACLALAAFARHDIRAHWRALLPAWPRLLLMGSLGFTAFNALFYGAAHHTSAINIAIIQGTIPVLVLLGSVLWLGTRIRLLQGLGVAITLAGIVVVASQGRWQTLAALQFNVGDVWIMLATVLYAGYTLALRDRPPVPPIVFFAALAAVAFVTSLPLMLAEALAGASFVPTGKGLLLILFIGLLPSFVSQLTFIHAVSLIGAARAGVYLNLTPVFGPLLAVLVLGEHLGLYHAAALALVLGGIALAERFGAARAGQRARMPHG